MLVFTSWAAAILLVLERSAAASESVETTRSVANKEGTIRDLRMGKGDREGSVRIIPVPMYNTDILTMLACGSRFDKQLLRSRWGDVDWSQFPCPEEEDDDEEAAEEDEMTDEEIDRPMVKPEGIEAPVNSGLKSLIGGRPSFGVGRVSTPQKKLPPEETYLYTAPGTSHVTVPATTTITKSDRCWRPTTTPSASTRSPSLLSAADLSAPTSPVQINSPSELPSLPQISTPSLDLPTLATPSVSTPQVSLPTLPITSPPTSTLPFPTTPPVADLVTTPIGASALGGESSPQGELDEPQSETTEKTTEEPSTTEITRKTSLRKNKPKQAKRTTTTTSPPLTEAEVSTDEEDDELTTTEEIIEVAPPLPKRVPKSPIPRPKRTSSSTEAAEAWDGADETTEDERDQRERRHNQQALFYQLRQQKLRDAEAFLKRGGDGDEIAASLCGEADRPSAGILWAVGILGALLGGATAAAAMAGAAGASHARRRQCSSSNSSSCLSTPRPRFKTRRGLKTNQRATSCPADQWPATRTTSVGSELAPLPSSAAPPCHPHTRFLPDRCTHKCAARDAVSPLPLRWIPSEPCLRPCKSVQKCRPRCSAQPAPATAQCPRLCRLPSPPAQCLNPCRRPPLCENGAAVVPPQQCQSPSRECKSPSRVAQGKSPSSSRRRQSPSPSRRCKSPSPSRRGKSPCHSRHCKSPSPSRPYEESPPQQCKPPSPQCKSPSPSRHCISPSRLQPARCLSPSRRVPCAPGPCPHWEVCHCQLADRLRQIKSECRRRTNQIDLCLRRRVQCGGHNKQRRAQQHIIAQRPLPANPSPVCTGHWRKRFKPSLSKQFLYGRPSASGIGETTCRPDCRRQRRRLHSPTRKLVCELAPCREAPALTPPYVTTVRSVCPHSTRGVSSSKLLTGSNRLHVHQRRLELLSRMTSTSSVSSPHSSHFLEDVSKALLTPSGFTGISSRNISNCRDETPVVWVPPHSRNCDSESSSSDDRGATGSPLRSSSAKQIQSQKIAARLSSVDNQTNQNQFTVNPSQSQALPVQEPSSSGLKIQARAKRKLDSVAQSNVEGAAHDLDAKCDSSSRKPYVPPTVAFMRVTKLPNDLNRAGRTRLVGIKDDGSSADEYPPKPNTN